MDRSLILPSNIEAEKTLLSACLISPEKASEAVELVKFTDFFHPQASAVFKAIESLVAQKSPIDAAGIFSESQDITLGTFLSGLLDFYPVGTVEYYSALVLAESKKRQMISKLEDARLKCFSGAPCDEILDFCQSEVMNVQLDTESGYESMGDLLNQAWDEYEAIESGAIAPGVMTGFRKLDGILGGLQKTDLIILAARPSMGKTAFVMNLVFSLQAANRGKVPTAVYSLEMSKKQLIQRAISSEALINLHPLRRGKLEEPEKMAMFRASEKLSRYPVFFEDKAAMTAAQIARSARRIKKKHGLGLIVIDYLQLMNSGKKENRTQEITEISRALKNMAKDLDVPVIALSQLNRGLESRADKRPILSDLRESGSIEQDKTYFLAIAA